MIVRRTARMVPALCRYCSCAAPVAAAAMKKVANMMRPIGRMTLPERNWKIIVSLVRNSWLWSRWGNPVLRGFTKKTCRRSDGQPNRRAGDIPARAGSPDKRFDISPSRDRRKAPNGTDGSGAHMVWRAPIFNPAPEVGCQDVRPGSRERRRPPCAPRHLRP